MRTVLRRVAKRFGGSFGLAVEHPLPDQIKDVPPAELSRLIDRRIGDGLGTVGRPQWVADNFASIEYVLLVPYSWNRGRMLRCNAVVFLPGTTVGRFPIDLSQEEYRDLPTLSGRSATTRLGDVLLHYPMLPLDEAIR
ncbi:hypothetical protein ACIBG5_30060 [Kribbella sp. NPDC050241]|uniref:hypothetical protein n=1 Tax=Kribbella sp. NPDC050241 TaxID=3364115 RepID=UPI003798B9AC